MTQDHGASAPQTGLSQAEPEVSALRASIPCAAIVLDVWGGPRSMEHVARYLVPIDDAWRVARAELEAGYLVNLRQTVAWGSAETFDSRAGAA